MPAYSFALTVFAIVANAARAHDTTLLLNARESSSEIFLPKALSDHSAVQVGDTKMYLTGGCDASDGNVFNKDIGEFICSSLSSSLYMFDTKTSTFTALAEMPRARYRHVAVATDTHIWLLGGRDLNDNLVGAVDVYDVSADAWTVFDTLNETYYTSDHTGFKHKNSAFFAGGYDSTYGFRDVVFAIDTEASLASGSLVIEDKAPLKIARGDISSTVDNAGTYAVVSGGFGTTNSFCAPLAEVELYDFEKDSWQFIAPMKYLRADKALVELNGNIIALGGERQIENMCIIDEPAPGEKTLAVDDVEVLNMETLDGGSEWITLQDLPANRFRFAAIGLDVENAIYTFGGQWDYDTSCQCHRTTAQVVIYDATEIAYDHDESAATDGFQGKGYHFIVTFVAMMAVAL
jgi:hypothetical protein